jgi:hypothetical protein
MASGRSAVRRTARLVRHTLLGLVAVGATVTPLVLVGLGDDQAARPRSGSKMVPVEAAGVRMMIPDDWNWRSDFISGFPRPALQAASLTPPPLNYELPSSQELLGPDDVRIVLVEYKWEDFPSIESPLNLASSAFDASHDVGHPLPSLREIPVGHSLARMTFELDGRLFDLRIEFGSDPAPEPIVAQVDEILRTFQVGEYREVPDGLCREEVGFGDPDCPEPQWVRRILERSGYNLVRDTGSPFVARGSGTEFFVIAEEVTEEGDYDLSDLGYARRANVDGVAVFGGDRAGGEWRWRVQGVDVWINEGPYGDSVFPTFEQIEPLVRASIEVSYGN